MVPESPEEAVWEAAGSTFVMDGPSPAKGVRSWLNHLCKMTKPTTSSSIIYSRMNIILYLIVPDSPEEAFWEAAGSTGLMDDSSPAQVSHGIT